MNGIPATREEALLLLKKWSDESSWLLYRADFSADSPSIIMNCRIEEVADEVVKFRSEDGRLIGLSLPHKTEFWFTEPHDLPELQEQIAASLHFVTFSSNPRQKQDHVTFFELKNGPIDIIRSL